MLQFDTTAGVPAETNKEWEEKLSACLLEKLEALGYEFDSYEEFLSFCKKRITRITQTNIPDKTFLYLDQVIRLVTIETTFEIKTENYSTSCVLKTVISS